MPGLERGFALPRPKFTNHRPSRSRGAPKSQQIPVAFQHIVMITPQIGWAVSAHRIWWTNHAGIQWINVTPRVVNPTGHFSALFVNAKDAIVAATSGEHVTIYRTTSSGKDWQTWSTFGIPRHVGVSLIGSQNPTALELWLEVTTSIGMGTADFDLYRSCDGGRTWNMIASTQASSPSIAKVSSQGDVTGFTFTSNDDGWLTRNQPIPGADVVAWTENGGRSWHSESLPQPSQTAGNTVIAFPPRFWHGTGILMAQWWGPTSGQSKAAYYTLSPGTTRWKLLSTLNLTGSQVANDFVTKHVGYTIIGSTLYRTADGGIHWQPILHRAFLSGVTQIDFVNPTTGILIGMQPHSDSPLYAITHTAGWHWTPIVPQFGQPKG